MILNKYKVFIYQNLFLLIPNNMNINNVLIGWQNTRIRANWKSVIMSCTSFSLRWPYLYNCFGSQVVHPLIGWGSRYKGGNNHNGKV